FPQTKPGVISSVLGKGPLQIQVVGKGLPQLVPSLPGQGQQLVLFSLMFFPAFFLFPCSFLKQLHKQQGAVLHPDYKTAFRSFDDALQRLLPYHVYQGVLPSAQDYRKVDEEFEAVSTQLLKRTQAMLNKYRLLLLEESRVSRGGCNPGSVSEGGFGRSRCRLSLPDEYVSSSSRSQNLSSSSSSASSSSSSAAPAVPPAPESLKSPPVPPLPPLHPTKLVIKHSGGSPSVTWAKAAAATTTTTAAATAAPPVPSPDEDALPSRSKPPIKTYEARSRIGLKLKIKQEAGLSKVVHNTALDPVHHPPPPPVSRLPKASDPHAAAATMNGTVDHVPPEKKPPVTYCRLPLRKTYRENVEASTAGEKNAPAKGNPPPKCDRPPNAKGEEGARGGAAAPKGQEEPPAPGAEKNRPEEGSKLLFFAAKAEEDSAGGLMKELAEAEDEFYGGVIKPDPPDVSSGPELTWGVVPLPPAKRRRSESSEAMDNASFSSDSPQDDSLTEHLQSAIDSILNLQQP
ncbi:BICRA protein, partial [Larus smithsonianus]|nr:BICRA protein [Larus smithsonianus]